MSVVERYLLAGCDPQSGSPSMGAGDSGGALLRGDSVIVGVWSFIDPDRATPPCPYASLAVRLDEPEVQAWIRSAVKKRLGVDRP